MIGILINIMSSAYAEGIIELDPSVALIRPKVRKKEALRALTPVDPRLAMKIVGHRDYQTTANIYTHLMEDSLKKAAADMATVFKKKKDAKQVKKAVGDENPWSML